MRRIIVSASPRRSQALNLIRTPGPALEQRAAQIPVVWPRYAPGVGTKMVAIPPERIPAGWQSVQIHVPMRLASCEEVDCPFFLGGWNRVTTGDGRRMEVGRLSQDEADARYGLYGPREIAPTLEWQEPGTPCERIHKVPSGIPPLYTVNGRTVLWSEFEDAIGGGLEHASRLAG